MSENAEQIKSLDNLELTNMSDINIFYDKLVTSFKEENINIFILTLTCPETISPETISMSIDNSANITFQFFSISIRPEKLNETWEGVFTMNKIPSPLVTAPESAISESRIPSKSTIPSESFSFVWKEYAQLISIIKNIDATLRSPDELDEICNRKNRCVDSYNEMLNQISKRISLKSMETVVSNVSANNTFTQKTVEMKTVMCLQNNKKLHIIARREDNNWKGTLTCQIENIVWSSSNQLIEIIERMFGNI